MAGSGSVAVHSVKLYVYEITRGMARTMSQALLGRQLDGVWHTGVMVYGNEYFFGSGGISYCPPSGTILGHPTEIVDLGGTEITQDIFHEYLIELSDGRFSGDKYHLLHHNCNNFSNEVAQFLTGRSIPEKITSLPGEVMSSPLGQIITPFINQMMNQVNAGTHIGGHSSSSSSTATNSNSNSGQGSTHCRLSIKGIFILKEHFLKLTKPTKCKPWQKLFEYEMIHSKIDSLSYYRADA